MTAVCACCGSRNVTPVANTLPLPVNACSLTTSAETSAAITRRPIELVGCNDCSFLWNQSFDTTLVEYDESYEGTQIHSPHFQAYLRETAQHWLNVLGPDIRSLFEVGCGQGEFLDVLADFTPAKLIGCDPAFRSARNAKATIHPRVVLSADAQDYNVVINRMTLEHVADPDDFMRRMAACVAPNGYMVTQIPNAARMIEKSLFCDLIYEHVNYFNAFAMTRLMQRLGFASNRCELSYDDQHLTVFSCRAAGRFGADEPAVLPDLTRFKANATDFADIWHDRLTQYSMDKHPVFVWGAGSRATTFINALPDPDLIEGVIDINPRRAGTFVQGTRCLTSTPEALCGVRAAKVVIMNPIYRREISATMARLAVDAEIVTGPL